VRHLLPAVVLVCASGAAFAQNPSANQSPSTPAVSSSGQNNAGAPAAGANSFTKSQATSRIEGAGYSNVTSLKKDKDGVWRGKGSKDGTPMDVSLDYQGNVVAK
jgi:hypothetical protein